MSVRVYVINDRAAIAFIEDNDLDGFRNYLAEDDFLMFDEPVEFDTKHEALAFCAGLGYGVNDRFPVDRFPLRSFEDYDQPFIEAIENY